MCIANKDSIVQIKSQEYMKYYHNIYVVINSQRNDECIDFKVL